MSSSSPKPKWSARMGSVIRRTSVLTISRQASTASERDTDNSSLSGSTKALANSTLISPPLPPVVTPTPIAVPPLREAVAEAPKPKWSARMGSAMRRTTAAFTISTSERDTDNSSLSGRTKALANSTQSSPPLPPVVTPSPIAKLPPREAATEAQEAVAVEPTVEPTTLNAPKPAEPAMITEELVDEPTSYFGGPMAESIKDFEPVDHADNTAELSEAVRWNANEFSSEPRHEQHGDVIPNTEEVVPENANNVVLPKPDLEHHEEPEALHHDDTVPVVTEREKQEESQQKSDSILIPVPVPNYDKSSYPMKVGSEREVWGGDHDDHGAYPSSSVPVLVPNYDMPSYPMNLGSEREVWGGEHDDHGAYPSSSIPVVNPSSEDVKRVERSPTPSIRVPYTDPFADPIAPRIPVSQPVLDMSHPEFESINDFELVDHADKTFEFIETDSLPPRDPAAEAGETHSSTGYIPPPLIDSTAGNPGAFTDITDDLLLPQPVIAQDPQAGAPVEETHSSPKGYIPPPVIDSTAGNFGAFTDNTDDLPQPVIAQDPQASAPVEETHSSPKGYIPPLVIDSAAGNFGAFTDNTDDLPQPVIAQDPQAGAPVEETHGPKGYIPPPVIDSTAGNPGAFTDITDDLPQPGIAQYPPVEPHVEPATRIVDKKGTLRSLVDIGTSIGAWLLSSILFQLRRRW